jgi:aryl carrier-like protein
MYRTGDKARQLPGGALQFLGRADRQIKIRGYRIEPEEIEKVLCSLPDVGAAHVVAQHMENSECVLHAFTTASNGEQLNPLKLEQYLASRLPLFMCPSKVRVVERFPLKLNGKVDTQSLLKMAFERVTSVEDFMQVKPQGDSAQEELVMEMTALFCRVLERWDVSPDDNFFERGGHSLRVLKMLSQLRMSHGITLPMKHFFASPTARGMAVAVQRSGKAAQNSQSSISTAWRATGQSSLVEK